MTEDAKRFAEATFMKKKMYYNMRIKTIKRTFSAIIKFLSKAVNIKKDLVNDLIAKYERGIVSLVSNKMVEENERGSGIIMESNMK